MILFKYLCSNTHYRYLFAVNWVAIGICAAWINFIFVVGRLPFRGGNFSIMFYTVSKNVFTYIIALIVMVIGFGLAFMITYHCQKENPFSDPYLVFRLLSMFNLIILNFISIILINLAESYQCHWENTIMTI